MNRISARVMLRNAVWSFIALCVFTQPVFASDDDDMYAVTITNLTPGETFTPILVVSHKKTHPLFKLGMPASEALAIAAESGNTDPILEGLRASGVAYDAVSTGALLAPGASVTVNVKTKGKYNRISVVSMLIPTNDAFIAVNGVKVKKHKVVMSPAYDAGSELNDELCANIPGPACGGEAVSAADGEGYVHIHGGIHGVGDLSAAQYDWRNPTAKIMIHRMR